MAINDYECASCHRLARDHYRPVGAPIDVPACCGQPMLWVPGGAHLDVIPEQEVFIGSERRVIRTLTEARAIERETEQLWKEGRGAPIRFRELSQDRSNKDENTFGPTPEERVQNRDRHGRPYVIRRGVFDGEQ